MHSILFSNCLWLLFYLFLNPVCIMFSDVPQTVVERKPKRMEGDVMRKEEALREPLSGLRKGEVKSEDFSLPECTKLASSKPVALHSDGDVVIGGFFPLHYVASKPEYSYNSKPQVTSCCG